MTSPRLPAGKERPQVPGFMNSYFNSKSPQSERTAGLMKRG